MSLMDRTNETIPLALQSIRQDQPTQLRVDVDRDSSIWTEPWVYIHVEDGTDTHDLIHLTDEEAGLLHDRLGLILGRARYVCSQEPHPGVEFYGTEGACAECGFKP